MSSSELQPIQLKKSRILLAGISTTAPSIKHWIVFLSESAAEFHEGSRNELADLVGKKASRRFHFLTINKPGVGPKKVDRPSFEKSFRRELRIEDALRTMKSIIPKNHSIHLIGYSEGAYLAPQVAKRDKRVVSVSMIGGGTRGWLKEEVSNASKLKKKLFRNKIRDIYNHSSSTKKWNGFSYATWYSYRGDHTIQALRGLKIPTLAILGARDRVIDLKTTIVDLVLVSERQPIQIHIFGNCGHYFSKHWREVEKVLSRFLMDRVRS